VELFSVADNATSISYVLWMGAVVVAISVVLAWFTLGKSEKQFRPGVHTMSTDITVFRAKRIITMNPSNPESAHGDVREWASWGSAP
jgi:hypothetical protein